MDYYRWIDPFEEIERANYRAARAREDGRNDVLNYEYTHPGLIKRAIEDQAYRVAERIVEEQIKPHFYDAMHQKRIRDATLDFLSFTPTQHIVAAVESHTGSRPLYDVEERAIGVVTEVAMKPFRYAVANMLP